MRLLFFALLQLCRGAFFVDFSLISKGMPFEKAKEREKMSQLWEQVYNFIATLSPGVKYLIAGVVMLSGIGFIVPSKKAKEWSKEQILSVIVGAILVLGGLAFAVDITSSFHFGAVIMRMPVMLPRI